MKGIFIEICALTPFFHSLEKEIETNVSLKVEKVSDGAFEVFGRGELQLAILIENMRREGFELSVTQPMVVMRRDKHGDVVEPMEDVTIQVAEEYSGAVIEQMNKRLVLVCSFFPIPIHLITPPTD